MRELKYLGVGTVEFLYEDGEFYFIEMNTRIQVEHPVTEMITDIDLILEQIRVADGADLAIAQDDVKFHGHAIECRINAENPVSFRPSPGKIVHYHPPGGMGVRIDSAAYQGYAHPALLRFTGRQAHRARQDPQRVPDAAQARARRVRGRRHRRRRCRCSARWCAIRTSSTAIITSTGSNSFSPAAGWTGSNNRCKMNVMAGKESAIVDITPQVLLKAYACGIFPMAESADDPSLYWVEPEMRGIIPLDAFHVSSRLARTVRSDRFTVLANHDFEAVIDGCAEAAPGRTSTWINERIRRLYGRLYDIGHCHTVEVYENGRACRRPLWRQPGLDVFRRKHVPPRSRCLESRAGASRCAAQGWTVPPARHAIRHRPPADLRRGRSFAPRLSKTACRRRCKGEAELRGIAAGTNLFPATSRLARIARFLSTTFVKIL